MIAQQYSKYKYQTVISFEKSNIFMDKQAKKTVAERFALPLPCFFTP